ncbi:Yip1 family protein [Roseovarius sp. Pro17]|uniref:Yip1 family protein n=1 Tax=Roseovarius sp. Pro17 TaxID=3108175 RepID=UPI002D76C700|nr:Yip1 family protein [Roseovarius sp. Pro17]
MNKAFAIDLFRQTLSAPRAAADRIMGLDLPRRWLWTALALMGVLNGIVYSLFLQVGGPPDPGTTPLIPPALQSPALFTMFLLGALVITVMTLTWVGKAMGGKAEVPQILALIAWLQVLRLAVQLALLVLMLALPLAGLVLVVVASVWGLVILVVFIDRAHGFENIFKAVAVIILAFLGMLIGLSAFLGVLATLVMGGA